MITVDGRVSEEKLIELLDHGGECAELDFKETLNLNNKKDELNFVKDVVSMLNNYPGGYLVIGATNEGKPTQRSDETDWKQLDGSILTDKVRRYVDARPEINCQCHELKGHKYCVISIMSLPDGLPIPFSKQGNCEGEKNPVFRRGDIVVRDGSGNGYIKYEQWRKLLARFERNIREDERSSINTLIDRISDALTDRGKTPPLFVDMPEDALGEALDQCFEVDDLKKIDRFLIELKATLPDDENSFVSLAAIGIRAALYNEKDLYFNVVDILYDCYSELRVCDNALTPIRLKIATAIYVIGGAAVGAKRWGWIAPTVNKQGGELSGYVYASWLRECQVDASRNDAFGEKDNGHFIATANKWVMDHPVLQIGVYARPEQGDTEKAEDCTLDALCGFDFLYCVCINAIGEGNAGAYPACALFKDKRVQPVVRAMLSNDEKPRRALLPDCTDEDVSTAFNAVWHLAAQQAMYHSRWFWGVDHTGLLKAFKKKYPPRDEEAEV